MPEKLLREIRKVKVRLEEYLNEEKEFIRELRTCIEKYMELNTFFEEIKTEDDLKDFKELINLRMETIKVLNEVLKKGSHVDHEKSHLLESYGAIILETEKEFKEILLRLPLNFK